MRKIIAQKLEDLQAEITEYEKEYPLAFPVHCTYKIMTAKRELLVELLNQIRK